MNRFKQFLLAIAGLLAFGGLGFAQTTTTYTTLSAAVTAPSASNPYAATITVASATGITGGQTALLIDSEVVEVLSVSGTTLRVRRGTNGTTAVPHANATPVVIGPLGQLSPFIVVDKSGSCTATAEAYLPQFNIKNGKMFDCAGGQWQEIGGPKGTYQDVHFCGDQPNNTTNYDSPIDGYPGGNLYAGGLTANDLSYLLAGTGCDAEDSTTEATADEVLFANNAAYLIGLSCTSGNAGSNGTTVNLRSAAAAMSPDITLTIPTSTTTGVSQVKIPSKVAAGATVAIRQISTEDLSATNIWCGARFQVLPAASN